ncbi:MAG: ATP-dependent Clp protease ATP-binding subunit [Candidatus Moraniibacteriota bacterium]
MIDNKIFEKMTAHAKSSLQESLSIAHYFDSSTAKAEHLLFAILLEKGSLGSNILKDLGIKKEIFEKIVFPAPKTKKTKNQPEISSELKKIITRAYLLASRFGYPYIGTEHLVFAIIEIPNENIKKILQTSSPTKKGLRLKNNKLSEKVLAMPINQNNPLDNSFLSGIFKALELPNFDIPAFGGKKEKNGTTPNLDFFCINLNEKVKKAETLLIGREKELERMFNSLGRKNKNNPLLIGDPGIGKTALVEGLAQRINEEKVPENLSNKKILALDMALVVAGTNFRGEFEQRLKDILEEASRDKNIIIFIDEIHGIVGAGNASGGLDAANILKPLLSQGHIRCIGATTLEEFKKYIEKDPALERRFQPIILKEPNAKDTLKIIKGIKKNYEKFHNIIITEEALESAVNLSNRYIQDRFQPDKSIDLIDETAARLKNKMSVSPLLEKIKKNENSLAELIEKKHLLVSDEKYDEAIDLRKEEEALIKKISQLKEEKQNFEDSHRLKVEKEDIAETVALFAQIPLEKILSRSSENTRQIEKKLNRIIIGQTEAIKKISSAIVRSQSGIGEEEKPLGSFLFLGPSGVGKTLSAKTLAQEFFGDPHALIKIDMSEFAEKHNVSRLIGAPAGYVGYGEGGRLTEKIRRQPYSLILFDEVEKAHPDVFNILLQILEDGNLTDAEGRRVDFKNTIIILTSNIGTREFTNASSIGFSPAEDKNKLGKKFRAIRQKVLTELKEKMKPEILNRLDEIIVFEALDEKDIAKIIVLEMKNLTNRLKEKKIKLTYSQKVIRFLLKKSVSAEKGARYIKKNIRDFVENEIAQKIAYDKIKNGTLKLDVKDNKVISR